MQSDCCRLAMVPRKIPSSGVTLLQRGAPSVMGFAADAETTADGPVPATPTGTDRALDITV